MPNVGDPILASQFGFLNPWATYVPALTASTTNPTLGTGASAAGSGYIQAGHTVIGKINLTFGTSGAAAGSGTYAVSLPVACVMAGGTRIGSGHIKVAGALTPFWLSLTSTTTCLLNYFSAAVNGTQISATNAAPGVWTNNDGIFADFVYQV